MKDMVNMLKFRFKAIHDQTDGFTWDYNTATDEEVFELSPIAKDTVTGLHDIILKIIKPEQRPLLRKHIAYIIGLRDRQAGVWRKKLEEYAERTKNTNQWVISNERHPKSAK